MMTSGGIILFIPTYSNFLPSEELLIMPAPIFQPQLVQSPPTYPFHLHEYTVTQSHVVMSERMVSSLASELTFAVS